MTRPKSCKRLRFRPSVRYYKPQGVPLKKLEEIILLPEEIEALKLKDRDNLDQTEAAEKMKTSQSTFQRILSQARRKLTEAIVEGKALRLVD